MVDFEKIKILLDTGLIICGRKIEEDGIIRFERVEPKDLEQIPEAERSYATLSMGRAIFSFDEQGNVHNYKGVDSKLQNSELASMELVNARAIEYVQGRR